MIFRLWVVNLVSTCGCCNDERARTHEAKIKRAAGKEGGGEVKKESTPNSKGIEVGWRDDLSRMKARSLDGRRREKGLAAIVRVV